jgi:recombinational DNA repair protein RecR
MAYTPDLSMGASSSLRRIAWALNVPMTKAIERVFETLPQILDARIICESCRDKSKCSECAFNSQNQTQQEKEVRYDAKSKRDTKHHH